MAKDPAFLFYPGDWLSGTMYLTHEQKGAYMDLLILQFNCGKFTEAQAKQVLSICFEVAWPMLKQKFIKDGDFYYNARLESEIERRKNFTESRRNNASGTKKQKRLDDNGSKKEEASAEHMLQHMEDENENINSAIDLELLSNIMQFFGFSININHDKKRDVNAFLKCMKAQKITSYFKTQFEAYRIVKTSEPKYKHALNTFLGSSKQLYSDGAWNSENWTLKIKVKTGTNPFNF